MKLNRIFCLTAASLGIFSLGLSSCTQPDQVSATAPDTVATNTAPAIASDQAQAPTSPRPTRPPLDVPYVPTPQTVVEEMLRIAQVNDKDVLYDLGSGDGRIVITAAQKYGISGVGVDIDPQRIEEAKANAQKAGVSDRVEFRQEDLFKTDFSKATVVTLYLLPKINRQLRPRLLKELKPGTRIVSHQFDMGDWKPEKVVQVDGRTIYYWVVPETVPENLQN